MAWQSIETAPKHTDILVWIPFTQCKGGMRQIAYHDGDDWIDDDGNAITEPYAPTLWATLLDAPPT